MISRIIERFDRWPKRQIVAKFLLDNGISVRDGSLFLSGAEISFTSIARALGVDQRVVARVVEEIEADEELREIFSRIKPALNPCALAELWGWTWVEIRLKGGDNVMRDIASAFGEAEVEIKYIIGDIDDSGGFLHILTGSEKIPGFLIQKIRKIPGVEAVVIR